jgi:hypothetical protein
MVVVSVPRTCTVTPAKGWPSAPVIFPETGKDCEKTSRENNRRREAVIMLRSNLNDFIQQLLIKNDLSKYILKSF